MLILPSSPNRQFATAEEIWDHPLENEFYTTYTTDATLLAVFKAVGRLDYDEEYGWLIPSPVNPLWVLCAADFDNYSYNETTHQHRFGAWCESSRDNLAVIIKDDFMEFQPIPKPLPNMDHKTMMERLEQAMNDGEFQQEILDVWGKYASPK